MSNGNEDGRSGGAVGSDWEQELKEDAEALRGAVKREEKRKRKLRAMEVNEVQALMREHSAEFGAVLAARRRLIELLGRSGTRAGGGGTDGSVGGEGRGREGGNYVVRHRQEGHIPENLVTAYEALWILSYGSGAGYIGDPNALVPTGAGGNQSKMKSSDERVYRGVAKGGGKGRGSTRSVIRDERAFEFKRKMDKRMRRMASEIDEWLKVKKLADKGVEDMEGLDGVSGAAVCDGCKRYMERDWKYCARCGKASGAFAERMRAYATRAGGAEGVS